MQTFTQHYLFTIQTRFLLSYSLLSRTPLTLSANSLFLPPSSSLASIMSSSQVNIAIPYAHLPASSSKQPALLDNDSAFAVSKRSDGANGVATINAYLHTALLVALLIVAVIFVSSSVGNGIGRSSESSFQNNNNAITAAPARALQSAANTVVVAVIGGVTGQSTLPGVTGGIELESITYGVSRTVNVGSVTGSSSSGVVQFGSLTMVVNRDAAYVSLFRDMVIGTVMTISVSYFKTGASSTPTRYALDTFATAELSAVTYNGDDTVTIVAAYRSLTTNYYAQTATGTTPTSASWNLATNTQNP